MSISNIIVRIRRAFTNHNYIYEVWDTSAVSVWLDKLKERITVDTNVKVVITEGVIHELSVGRHKYEKARNAYRYIKQIESDNVIKEVTMDKIRAWTVDEQIIFTADTYHKKGRDVTLITCDQDQAFKAELRGLKVKLLEAVRPELEKQIVTPNYSRVVFVSSSKEPPAKLGDEITLTCSKLGKEHYLDVKSGMVVYDNKGKRKIGRNKLVPITISDRVSYYNMDYFVKSISDRQVILNKM